jgi:3-dehydroquinate dehydratase I
MKSRTLSKDKVTLCVPVMGKTAEAVIKEVENLTAAHTEAIEWRIDHFEDGNNAEKIIDVLNRIVFYLGETILIVTYRTKKEGGEGSLSRAEYEELLQKLSESAVIDYLDYEIIGAKKRKNEIHKLQANGRKVIASNHHFEGTPKKKELLHTLEYMAESGADVAKIAVMPNKLSDTMRLLHAAALAKEEYPEQLFITIAMGKEGAITRLIGEATGSCLSFVTAGKASAPGQMSYQAVENAREAMHLCLTEGEKNEP